MNLHGNNLTVRKMTYQLPDEVFNIVKAFMISKYRKIKHFPLMNDLIDRMPRNYHIYLNRDDIKYEYCNDIKQWEETIELDKLIERFGKDNFLHMWKNSLSKTLIKRGSRIIAKKWITLARKNGTHNQNLTVKDYIDLYIYGEFQAPELVEQYGLSEYI